MTSVELTALPDGPYRVTGDITILDREGRPLPDSGSPVHLCRCGRCDGTHAQTGWNEEA